MEALKKSGLYQKAVAKAKAGWNEFNKWWNENLPRWIRWIVTSSAGDIPWELFKYLAGM